MSRLTASPGDPAAANKQADDGGSPDDRGAGEAEDSSEGEGEEDPMITLMQMRQLNGGRQEYVGPMAGCTAVVALVSGACPHIAGVLGVTACRAPFRISQSLRLECPATFALVNW